MRTRAHSKFVFVLKEATTWTQAIKTLSEKEQMVISLYYREELTMREVADVMDLAESRVSQIHSLAITKLRAAIQKMQLEEDTFR